MTFLETFRKLGDYCIDLLRFRVNQIYALELLREFTAELTKSTVRVTFKGALRTCRSHPSTWYFLHSLNHPP